MSPSALHHQQIRHYHHSGWMPRHILNSFHLQHCLGDFVSRTLDERGQLIWKNYISRGEREVKEKEE